MSELLGEMPPERDATQGDLLRVHPGDSAHFDSLTPHRIAELCLGGGIHHR